MEKEKQKLGIGLSAAAVGVGIFKHNFPTNEEKTALRNHIKAIEKREKEITICINTGDAEGLLKACRSIKYRKSRIKKILEKYPGFLLNYPGFLLKYIFKI